MAVVTVFGGTGFLGRRIVERLAGAGEVVRNAARHPERAGAGLSHAGTGHAIPIAADITVEESLVAAVARADGVVNAVSAYVEKNGVTYRAVHVQGARNVAKASAAQKVTRLVHISGIGANPGSPSAYVRARGEGEDAVRQAFPEATVLRPSVMFARDDAFINALAQLVKTSPVIPLIGGGDTRLQPVHADDVAEAVCAALREPSAPTAIYELGGPESFTLRELIEMILSRTRRRRRFLPIPFELAHLLAHLLERLPRALLTVAQVDLLKANNVPAPGSPGLADLGIVPRKIQEVIAALAVG